MLKFANQPIADVRFNQSCIPWCYQQFFRYRYFAGIRFIWRSVFLVGITNLAGTPFFHKRGAGCIKKGANAPFFLKKGASAPFLREIGFPAKKIIPKCTNRDFLRYRYGKYQEIPTDTDRKIPIRYTTLDSMYSCTRSLNLKADLRSKYVLRCTTYYCAIPTWISHHLSEG